MKRRVLLSGLAAGMTRSSLGLSVEQQFKFKLPPSFKPPSEVTAVEGILEEGVLEEARGADAYGVLMVGGELAATFSATEAAGAAPLLHTFASVQKGVETAPNLKGARALSIQTPTIAGVLYSRVEIELAPETASRLLMYALPGGERWAAIRMVALSELYPALAKQVDAWVAKLPGIEATADSVREESSLESRGKWGVTIALAALGGVGLGKLLNRSRSRQAQR